MPKLQDSDFNKKRAGFTLIELMVTITIIAIISSIGFVTYANAQLSARDARRKSDLRSIATALELYQQKNGRFPCLDGDGWALSSDASAPWITDANFADCAASAPAKPLDTTYINQLPVDPKSNTGNPINTSTYGYAYGYGSATAGDGNCPTELNGNYYVLVARLENANDPASNKNKSYKWCDGTDMFTNDDFPFVVTSE
jgi:prepilin-type N-terminal cleavage/methylation domain-containing protein